MESINDNHVQTVYNHIASHFDETRYKKWNSINKFLDNLPKNQFIVEIGCGNGKNILDNRHYYTGFDFSEEFAKICKSKHLEVGVCNNLNIPLKNDSFDCVISIAVIHHLSSIEKRKKCIDELIRICRPGGKIFIQVWGFERETGKKYDKQDNYIDWTYKKTGEVFKRYYHFFKKGELESLLPVSVKILESKFELNNYIIIIEK